MELVFQSRQAMRKPDILKADYFHVYAAAEKKRLVTDSKVNYSRRAYIAS